MNFGKDIAANMANEDAKSAADYKSVHSTEGDDDLTQSLLSAAEGRSTREPSIVGAETSASVLAARKYSKELTASAKPMHRHNSLTENFGYASLSQIEQRRLSRAAEIIPANLKRKDYNNMKPDERDEIVD